MIDEKNYFLEIDFARQRVIDLPAGEFKYYLYILLESIKSQKCPVQTRIFSSTAKIVGYLA